ncbi:ABC transporter ATP-binding protein [bacterium]|nr:ABC transporter ATP-binding protein [bacterium]
MNLEIRQLTFGWGETPLLEGIDLSAAGGTMALLQGENGSGKTTLLRLLAGMIPHFSRGRLYTGDVLINGSSIRGNSPKEFFPLIAFIPSKYIDFYVLNTTLAEELMLIEAVLPDSGAAVRERAALFREFFPAVDGLLSMPFTALSEADLRVCLACIYFVQGARLWLLDEPFRQPSPRGAGAWEPFFRFLRQQEAIIIASTHTRFGSGLPVWCLQGGRLYHD